MKTRFALIALLTPLLAMPAHAASFNIAGGGSSSFTIHGNTSSNRYSGAGDLRVRGDTSNFRTGNNSLRVRGDTSDFKGGSNSFRTDGYGFNLGAYGRSSDFNFGRQNNLRVRDGSRTFNIAGRASNLRTDGTRRLEVRGGSSRFNVRGASNRLRTDGNSGDFRIYR